MYPLATEELIAVATESYLLRTHPPDRTPGKSQFSLDTGITLSDPRSPTPPNTRIASTLRR